MSISLQRITKRYHDQPVVNDVSLDIAEGEFFVLLGPSGSGKSTLLRAIAGLADVDHGSISLHGKDVTHLGARARGVGFVFQNYALFRHLTVAQNIEFALRIRRTRPAVRQARRRELLKLVALEGYDERLPSQLSGGQQQRVAVARALAHEPQVLLLDEPFGALDAKIREELRRTIRAVQRQLGITTVLVTHDQEEAFALADRIGVMNLGRLLETGAPHALYARPTTRFVATFLGAANLLLTERSSDGLRIAGVGAEATEPALQLGSRVHQVVAMLRPEEVEIAVAHAGLNSNPVGAAIVQDVQFTGALERLRLKLVDASVTLHQRGDAAAGLIEATRTQVEQRGLPLRSGDVVTLGARRLHVLPTPLSSFVLHATDERQAQALTGHPLVATLATRMNTRIAAGSPQARPATGVAVIASQRGAATQAVQLLQTDANEALIVPDQASLPRNLCLYWTDADARPATFAVSASLLRHLSAGATCVAVSHGTQRDARQVGLRTLLDAHAEARAAHGLDLRTELLEGRMPEALHGWLDAQASTLLVLGTSDLEACRTLLAGLLARHPHLPVLVVYREPQP